MELSAIYGRYQGLGESLKTPGGGGRLDLRQVGPRVDCKHGGGTSPPPGAKYSGTTQPFSILETQHRIGWNNLERLVEKICSMHLTVPEVVAHLYHIHHNLYQGEVDRAWLFPAFQQEIVDFRSLVAQTIDCIWMRSYF